MNGTAVFTYNSLDYGEFNPYNRLMIDDKASPETTQTVIPSQGGFFCKVRLNQVRELRYIDPINVNLNAKIIALTIPAKWQIDGVEEPNYLCKQKAIDIAQHLLRNHNLHPDRIGSSIEGGVLLHYVNYISKRTLSIEIGNDLEIAAIVNWNKRIEKSADIFNFDFTEIIRIYAC